MLWLIHRIGEERALGAGNVIRRPDGSTLLTNPGAMARWVLVFWALGALQISGAISLLVLGSTRIGPRGPATPG